jgi:hypothetical protein
MIHGVIQDGTIQPLEPIPPEWGDGRRVVIESEGGAPADERDAIERWFAELEALGPARYEPGEREQIERLMADADREAKEYVKRSWAGFDDTVPARHQSP